MVLIFLIYKAATDTEIEAEFRIQLSGTMLGVAFWVFIFAMIAFILLMAASELILLAIDVEANTRRNATG